MGRPFMHGFAAKNDHQADETSQRDRDLRGNTKSFARFHCYGVIRVVEDRTSASPLFFAQARIRTIFLSPQLYQRSNRLCLIMFI